MHRQYLINFITKNEYIKSKTTFKEQLKMIKWIKSLSEQELKQVINEATSVPRPPTIVGKVLNVGLASAAIALPGGVALHAAVKYLMDDYNYKCELKCQKDESIDNKPLCNKHCVASSLKYIVMRLDKEFKMCNSSKDPGTCRKKLLPLLKEYRNRYNTAQIKLSYATKKARMRG